MLNLGGNVCAIGKRQDGKPWNVGIQNPNDEQSVGAVVSLTDMAAVTSGDYQRYYEVDGVRYNHIIDGTTLMPATRYASVTILSDNAGIADMLSTALFILPEDEGDALAAKYNAGVCRIYKDGTTVANEVFKANGYKNMNE
jgi:thiamine biosynthesis lipoprotein